MKLEGLEIHGNSITLEEQDEIVNCKLHNVKFILRTPTVIKDNHIRQTKGNYCKHQNVDIFRKHAIIRSSVLDDCLYLEGLCEGNMFERIE